MPEMTLAGMEKELNDERNWVGCPPFLEYCPFCGAAVEAGESTGRMLHRQWHLELEERLQRIERDLWPVK